MPDLWSLQNEYRAKLEQGEREQINRLIRAYGEIWVRAKGDLDDVLARIAEEQQAGQPMSLAWVYQEERARALMAQAQWEIKQWSRQAEAATADLQRHGIDVGAEEADALLNMASVGGTFTSLPRGAVEQMVGFTADGTPLSRLLDEIGPDVRDGLERALVVGIGTGQHPTEVARQMRKEFAMGLDRALRIARTEMLRAWRESSRQTYLANQDFLSGWVWHAHRGANTCASCLAMDGTFHTFDEHLDDHPNGRCAMMPVTRSWNELGFTGIKSTRPPDREDTEEWLRSQPISVQDKVFGKGAAALWRAGKVGLHEFTEQRSDLRWGTMRTQASLAQVLRRKQERWSNFPLGTRGPTEFMRAQGFDTWITKVVEVSNPECRGTYNDRGIISLDTTVAYELRRGDPSGYRTLLHETYHSASYASDPTGYWKRAAGDLERLENISVEWLARERLRRLMADHGTPYRDPTVWGYEKEMDKFNGIVNVLGLSRQQVTRIIEQSLRVPIDKREIFLYNEFADEAGVPLGKIDPLLFELLHGYY